MALSSWLPARAAGGGPEFGRFRSGEAAAKPTFYLSADDWESR